ncbi:S-adenosyl-l-methionine hydroxide adenosyltransferase family protein [Candidatus Bathyarchaeota archaeon]|nr:S-adenosyl-l-methionine hydroxide adenosyltransferase family protein [Candidatus Bathyarchaeota archaeon]
MSISTIMPSKIVTLTTDFGLKDPYAAEMKAAILSICPNTVIVDITHDIAKFNIRMGAYMLASAVPYFSKGSIHVAVVDPSVGTRRRPILIQTRQGFFVGPDNGILVLAAEKQGIMRVHELANPRFMLPKVSNTFHGRDIFAPAAAHLLNGVKPAEFGPEIREAAKPEFARVKRRNGVLVGEVLQVDGFGNIITNINEQEVTQSHMKGAVSVELPSYKLKLKLCKAYGETKPHEPLALIGSHGFLEIALNQGSAAEKFKTKPGDAITILPT